MTNLPSANFNGLETPSKQVGEYSTLKKSLSGSLNNRSKSPPKFHESLSDSQEDGEVQFPHPILSSPLHVNIPKIPSAAEVALAALQTLPTPLLVLSSLKTVILANEALGRLLGLDALDESQVQFTDGSHEEAGPLEMLRGKSLSQLGIDMIQNGQQIWVSWEVWHSIGLFQYAPG